MTNARPLKFESEEKKMKYCPKCGTMIEDTTQECPKCHVQINNSNQKQASEMSMASAAPKKQINSKIIAGSIASVVALVVVLIVIFTISSRSRRTINLNDYISVTFSGYESVGKATVHVDSAGLNSALLKAVGRENKKNSNLNDAINQLADYSRQDLEEDAALMGFAASIRYEIDKAEDLSNGDTVKLSISYDKSLAEKCNLIIKCESKEYKADSLEEAQKIDFFKTLEVSFEGYAPNGRVTIENKATDDVLKYIRCSADPDSGLDIGDKVTVAIRNEDVNSLTQKGYVLKNTSKEYKVEKLDAYVTSEDKLSEVTMNAMKKEANDLIESKFANKNGTIGYTELNYVGCYILNNKKSSNYNGNKIYLVYDTTISNLDADAWYPFDPFHAFIVIKFSNVVTRADGTQEFGDPDMSGNSMHGIYGYEDSSSMYNDIVKKSKSEYTYSMSDSLKVYGE